LFWELPLEFKRSINFTLKTSRKVQNQLYFY